MDRRECRPIRSGVLPASCVVAWHEAEISDQRTDLTDRQKRQSAVGVGVAIGSGVGVALGVALDNIAVGVAVGVGVGVALGAALK